MQPIGLLLGFHSWEHALESAHASDWKTLQLPVLRVPIAANPDGGNVLDLLVGS